MAAISMKQLLEAGVHFGHQTKRWNPKMKPYIFGERNGIYIIDLQKTIKLFKDAVDFITHMATQGKTFLFVGTKRQAQDAIVEEASRCGMYYVNNRWLGGLLTNFSTIQNSIKRFKELETMKANGHYERLSKKETARLERERRQLEKNLLGIRDMPGLPDVLFVIDSKKEAIAVSEAKKLGIPLVAVVDTNCDPDDVDFVIPGNDDALRAVRLFASTIADAIIAGHNMHQMRREMEAKDQAESAAAGGAARMAIGAPQFEIDEAQSMEQAADARPAGLGMPQAVAPVARESARRKTAGAAPVVTELNGEVAVTVEPVGDVPIETES
ncbi:MAG: 30S ribosomal protein S2 [Acidobacteria bacterium]|nr:30S ribosomal protein S2 [Acidobacteriota bacterium]